ncbi:nuclear transport factor 2 family protein [Maribacter sp.]|nr:nuclear transport factor 2 family protein [Maribacter sp.]
MTKEILLKFAEAFGNQKIDEIASFFTNDCTYKASVGPEPGTTYKGKASVMKGIENMIKHDSGGESYVENIKIYEGFGVWEWTYRFKDNSKVCGCDLFEFKGDKIKMINAFRKTTV